MAQKSYWNFKDTLLSNSMNNVLLGLLEPGRYRGFDSMNVSGLNLTLTHTITGIKQTLENLTQTTETAIVYTKQGYVIQEDAAISGLSCLTNASNAFIRTDLVIQTHQDVNTIGGSPATYSIITGPNGSPTPPALPNPTYQVIIGYISIPASAANLTGATYTPAKTPLLGNQVFNDSNFPYLKFYALLGGAPNNFTKVQRWGKASTDMVIDGNNKINFNTEGNLFKFAGVADQTADEMDAQGEGTVLFFINNTAFNLNINLNVTPDGGGLPFDHDGLRNGLSINTYTLQGNKNDIMGMVQDAGVWKIFTVPYYLYSTLASTITQLGVLANQNPNNLVTKTIAIGVWNMDADDSITITHGITGGSAKIRSISVIIRDDVPFVYTPLDRSDPSTGIVQGGWILNSAQISLLRLTGGIYDTISYDDVSAGWNRGYITITYAP